MAGEWAENRLADFNLWASGIGASSRHRASLDARLSVNKDARDFIHNLLRALHNTLEQCKDLAQGKDWLELTEGRGRSQDVEPSSESRSFSPWSTPSDLSSNEDSATSKIEPGMLDELHEAKRSVDAILNQLVVNGVLIRRAGNRSRLQKADKTFAPEKYDDFRKFLETLLLSQGPHTTSDTFTPAFFDPSKLSGAQKGLIHANLKRRNRFVYAQKHSTKLDATLESPGQRQTTDNKPAIDAEVKIAVLNEEAGRQQYRVFCFRNYRSIADCHQAAISTPSGSEGRRTCFSVKQLWASHLLEDHSSKEYWICYACNIESKTYGTEAALESHILDEHSAAISTGQIPLLIEASRVCTPAEINACPICNWPDSEGIQFEAQTTFDHIAEHIHSFSLLSLPWAPDDDSEHQSSNHRSVAIVEAWLSDSTPIDLRTIPESLKHQSRGTEYFHQNDYFGEGATGSNGSSEGTGRTSAYSGIEELEKMREEGSLKYASNEEGSAKDSLSASVDAESDSSFHAAPVPFSERPIVGEGHESSPTFVFDPEGGMGQPRDGNDDRSNFRAGTVSHLGLDAAPDPRLLQTCECSKRDSKSILLTSYMDSPELQIHHGLPADDWLGVVEFVVRELRKRLVLIDTPISRNWYIPIDKFDKLFCLETVKAIVKEWHPKDFKSKTRQIQPTEQLGTGRSRRRILGVLILMDSLHHMDQFIRANLWDRDLPISKDGKSEVPSFVEEWDLNEVILFKTYQQYFFVPFFNFQPESLSSYRFDRDVILPWLEYTSKSAGSGGVVYQVAIHPSHHNFSGHTDSLFCQDPDKPRYFALKEIHASDRNNYKKELSALEKTFGSMQHDKHLIKLLLTFQHGDRFFLIFEWADGNLEEFWKLDTTVRGMLDDQWIFSQCLGIATSLKRIHGMSTWQVEQRKLSIPSQSVCLDYGRHGDIKARNILWFDRYEDCRHLLVLSDLGLTRYHSQSTQSRVPYNDLDGTTRRYEAPELLIWYFLGQVSAEDFNDTLGRQTKTQTVNFTEDNFFNIEEANDGNRFAVVKPAVQEWKDTILEHTKHSALARDMLNLITKHMLVVEPKKRWKIDKICTELRRIKDTLAPVEAQSVLGTYPIDQQHQGTSLSTMYNDLQHAWAGTDASVSPDGFFNSDGTEPQQPTKGLVEVVERANQLILNDKNGIREEES
ncbi:WD repeat-containing protein 88 [Apiospora saccharicola]|uniref:WD repeat-containing protein 88 n=1 Tax=Apiospora saccharicola TaxID=335842 RepID=A0ABR1UJZ8_9PEZI